MAEPGFLVHRRIFQTYTHLGVKILSALLCTGFLGTHWGVWAQIFPRYFQIFFSRGRWAMEWFRGPLGWCVCSTPKSPHQQRPLYVVRGPAGPRRRGAKLPPDAGLCELGLTPNQHSQTPHNICGVAWPCTLCAVEPRTLRSNNDRGVGRRNMG